MGGHRTLGCGANVAYAEQGTPGGHNSPLPRLPGEMPPEGAEGETEYSGDALFCFSPVAGGDNLEYARTAPWSAAR